MLVYKTQFIGVAAVVLVVLFFFSVSQYSSFSPSFSSRASSTVPDSATGLLKDVYNETLGVSLQSSTVPARIIDLVIVPKDTGHQPTEQDGPSRCFYPLNCSDWY